MDHGTRPDWWLDSITSRGQISQKLNPLRVLRRAEKFMPSRSVWGEFTIRLEKGWFLSTLSGLIPPNADISSAFLVDWFRRKRRASAWHTSLSPTTPCKRKHGKIKYLSTLSMTSGPSYLATPKNWRKRKFQTIWSPNNATDFICATWLWLCGNFSSSKGG